jgi:hypothetical protein
MILRRLAATSLAALILVGLIPAQVFATTPPDASAATVTTTEDHAKVVTLSAEDPDGTNITSFDIQSGPSDGSRGSISGIDCTPGPACTATVTYTPNANTNGTDQFTFTATDTDAETSSTATAHITIDAVNDPPSFTKGANQVDLEDDGAQSNPGWATGISKGPADESGQTVSFSISSNSNPSLFSSGPAVSAAGNLSYTTAPDANGAATIGVTAHDSGGVANGGDDTSAEQTFTITVTAVNDEPSFTKGADQGVDEDAGAQSVPGWATNLSAGPPDESGQTLSFGITSDSNAALFAVLPAVAPDGTLTYTPADDANGTATIGVRIQDNGGVANGGDGTSDPQTFTITIPAVNDPPSFTKGADVSVDEDSGLKTVAGWATAISKGASNESSQTLTFTATPDDPSMFATGPSISASGTLTFTPADDANGSTDVDVSLQDNGGGSDTSATQTFTITIDGVNDEPSFTKGGNQTVSEDAGAQSVPGWATAISSGPANESGQDVTFVVGTPSDPTLFAVAPAVAANGTLSYTPAADANGTSTVTVKITDGGGTANGGDDTSATQTFSITVTPVNDVPSFTKGADASSPEQASASTQTVTGWATSISAGPADESSQALSFEITGNDNTALFSIQPAVSAATGNLTFRPIIHGTGVAHVTVRIHDDGGTADGGVDTSADQSFTIDVSGVNDAPIAGNDVATARLAGPTTINVLGNDSGGPGEPADPIVITSVHEGSRGMITVSADRKSLTYDPIGCTTGTDVFTYTITDTNGDPTLGLKDTATVFVTIAGPSAYPVADGPRPSFVTGSTIGSSTPVRLSWCGVTSGSTLKSYRLYQSRSGGTFATVVSSTTATASTRNLANSTSYQFKARYTDKKNRTAIGTGLKFKAIRTQDTSGAIVYSSGWGKTSKGSPSGGTTHTTTGKAKSATLTYTGRGFAIVGTIGKSRGSFFVYVDGVKVTSKSISTRATKTHERRVLYSRTTINGTHTIRIVTSGNGRVDLDAILTLTAG